MDLLITLVLIYLAYRGYRWYSQLQEQVKAGGRDPFRVRGQEPEPPSNAGDGDDYIDYEELD